MQWATTRENKEVVLPDKKYFKISEASSLLGVNPHILRYWEAEFPQIQPYKSKTGQRLYRKKDVEALAKIQKLLYEDHFTLAGAHQALRLTMPIYSIEEQGVSLPSEADVAEMELYANLPAPAGVNKKEEAFIVPTALVQPALEPPAKENEEAIINTLTASATEPLSLGFEQARLVCQHLMALQKQLESILKAVVDHEII